MRKRKIWFVPNNVVDDPQAMADAVLTRLRTRDYIQQKATLAQMVRATAHRARAWLQALPKRGRALLNSTRQRLERLPFALRELPGHVLAAMRPARPKVELYVYPPVLIDGLHARWGRLLALAESQLIDADTLERTRELLAHAFPGEPTSVAELEDGARVLSVDVLLPESPRWLPAWRRLTATLAGGQLTSHVAMVDAPKPLIGPPPWEGELPRIAAH